MDQCECFHMTCRTFFSEGSVADIGIGQVFKQRYCDGPERDSCARYLIRNELGPSAVPHDLWPNHVAIATKLLADAGR